MPNERLEFLGDAVLSLVVAEQLYTTRPELAEGDLTRIRAAVVRTTSLAEAARALGVGEAVHLGRGEERSGGRAKDSILADTLEAIIGATYLVAGLEAARSLVLDALGETLSTEASRAELGDAKNRLQELAARMGRPIPVYRSTHTGPDHARWWHAEVLVGIEVEGYGEGVSRRAAESAAAAMCCEALIELGHSSVPRD